jgi:hypothetical protein
MSPPALSLFATIVLLGLDSLAHSRLVPVVIIGRINWHLSRLSLIEALSLRKAGGFLCCLEMIVIFSKMRLGIPWILPREIMITSITGTVVGWIACNTLIIMKIIASGVLLLFIIVIVALIVIINLVLGIMIFKILWGIFSILWSRRPLVLLLIRSLSDNSLVHGRFILSLRRILIDIRIGMVRMRAICRERVLLKLWKFLNCPLKFSTFDVLVKPSLDLGGVSLYCIL